jgi:hypothetical protein
VISSGRALLADAMPRGPVTTAEALLAMADGSGAATVTQRPGGAHRTVRGATMSSSDAATEEAGSRPSTG